MAVRLRPIGQRQAPWCLPCRRGSRATRAALFCEDRPRPGDKAIAPAPDFQELRFPLVHLMNLWSSACIRRDAPHGHHTSGRAASRCRRQRIGDAGDRAGASTRRRQSVGCDRRRALGCRTSKKPAAKIVTLPMASKNPLTILANARRLFRLVEGRGVDLLHARSRAPAWSALLAARRSLRPSSPPTTALTARPAPSSAPITASWGAASASSPTRATRPR